MSRSRRFLIAVLAAAAVAFPASAFAQTDTPPVPSFARPTYGSNEEVVRGVIASFDGGYNLQVRDERGYLDTVTLHQGTIINPTGLRLSPGMSVTVRGVNRGNALDANQIDTPYTSYAAVPVYPYPVAPYYGYPGYGYGYGYGYGPRFGIGIGFGPSYGWGGRGRWR